MEISDFETLADFLLKEKKWDQVIKVIRVGVRWLQGRELEKIWDLQEDDREFDEKRQERVGWEKGSKFLEGNQVHYLDNRLRLRLGLARAGKGDMDEALVSPIFFFPFTLRRRELMREGDRCTLRLSNRRQWKTFQSSFSR